MKTGNRNLTKKALSVFLALVCFVSCFGFTAATTAYAADASGYTYEITPIIEGMNEYFYVKTNNPDPTSFRFIDKNTKYSDPTEITLVDTKFADVIYENEKTYRVKGGYIFESFYTDGGSVVLQETKNDGYSWKDTKITCQLPSLVDEYDYLIKTYATKDSFFDNMDSVQSGLDSICIYSGSFIRGKLVKKPDKYWGVSAYNHRDQSFYIFSPYERNDNERLFASAIYPFVHDSLGFPSVMARVASRLDGSAKVQWNSYAHYLVDVTYNDETRSYGGQGSNEGQGIDKKDIIRKFNCNTTDSSMNFESLQQLLIDYSKLDIKDDIPRSDALTWSDICNAAGDGMWANVIGGISFFYKRNDDDSYYCDEWGTGYSIYWGGSLGYASDTWVDGRYVDNDEVYVPGAKFEEHPTSDIYLTNVDIPFVTYESSYNYDYEAETWKINYTNVDVALKKQCCVFSYDTSSEKWIADSHYEQLNKVKSLVKANALDKKYLDMFEMSLDDVKALKVDRNTNKTPSSFSIYNQNFVPGTQGGYADNFFYSANNNGTATIYDYDTSKVKGNVTIPSKVNNITVTALGMDLFTFDDNITSLTIPNTVRTIESKVMRYCYNLKTVKIPSSVTEIGKDAFYGCDELTIETPCTSAAAKYAVENGIKAKLTNHSEDTTLTKATMSKNGSIVSKCTKCKAVVKSTAIYYPKTITLSATSFSYDGKVKTPTITVKDSKGKTIAASNYTVSYASGRKNVGKYAVKITFKGNYSGNKTLYFNINPKNTSITSLTAGSKRFTIKLKKYTTQTTGYQIQYATNSSFNSAKSVTISNKTTSKTISKLSGKKKYYVRIRTYKTVNGTKYYSSWSKAKAVTTKK